MVVSSPTDSFIAPIEINPPTVSDPATPATAISPSNGVRVDVRSGCPLTVDGQRDDSSTAATWTVNPDPTGLAETFVPGSPTAALICRYDATESAPELAAPLVGGQLFSSTRLGGTDAQHLANVIDVIEPSSITSACNPTDSRPRYTAIVFEIPGRADTDLWLKQWYGCPELTNGARASGELINGVGTGFLSLLDELAPPAPQPA